MKRILLLLTLALSGATAPAQEPQGPWTLDDCIDFAREHSTDAARAQLNAQQSEIELNTARMSRLPDVNASLNSSLSFGRSITRDNTYAQTNLLSGSVSASASLPIFQGLRINHRIRGFKLDLQAALQDLERVREDIAINVTTAYLQALLCRELVGVARTQLELSARQVADSRELVASGRQSESTLYEAEALEARDRLSLTQAENNLSLALLDLSQLLNRPQAEGFDIADTQIDSTLVDRMAALPSPDQVYAIASDTRPHLIVERLRLERTTYTLREQRSYRYPSLMLSGGYGSNLYKSYASGALNDDFWSQLKNNGNQYVGLSLSIPIFNRMATRNGIRTTKLQVENQRLALTDAERALRKQIEQAYYTARAAYEQYRSARTALHSARTAFVYAQAKTAAGRATIFDFNDAKTQMERAASELVQAKYEFVFRAKILGFYAGEALTL